MAKLATSRKLLEFGRRTRTRDLFFAFLLGCCSWFVLTRMWNRAPQGGLLDKVLGTLLFPPYRLGKHLAHVIFSNEGTRNITGAHVAPFVGVAVEILFLMALWTIAISLFRCRGVRKAGF